MPDLCYIGVDTSNYTTSAAICGADGEILANLKLPLPVGAGEHGLRQSDAVFAHVKNLPVLMRKLEEELRGRTPVAIGVSARPRDAENSYMPCFLSGVAAAQSFAAGLHLPLYEFSHQSGHIMAALYSARALHLLGRPFGAFHVSGGTTEMLFVTPFEKTFRVECVGGTADLHAGQVIDRVGVAMGLDFPCGPALEQLAAANDNRTPRPRVSVREGRCNLSGLENMAAKLLAETGDKPLVAAFVLDHIAETLAAMATFLRETRGDLPLLFAGGVMSDRVIAQKLSARFDNAYFAEPAFSADNAAGIALLCRMNAQK